tara:strand:+ start:616 stop:753 length:138 start_codon:yes stop_codon:yes gene_type:complete
MRASLFHNYFAMKQNHNKTASETTRDTAGMHTGQSPDPEKTEGMF